MEIQKVPANEFKKSIKNILAANPKYSPNGRGVGAKLKEMGFLTTKELEKNKVKAGNCSKYEITIGRGVAVFTNVKLKAS